MKENRKTGIEECVINLHKSGKHRYRLRMFGHYLAALFLISFFFILFPLFLVIWFGSRAYFWLCNEKPIPFKPFVNFDRHKIAHLKLVDKISCEYCEWANGLLQWCLEISNKIERRFCPIQNSCAPHCEKAKAWRKDFLPHNHSAKKLEDYYKHYPSE